MLLFVPFIIAGGLMWLVAHQIAPYGYDISLTRAVITILLMGLWNGVVGPILEPAIGGFVLLADFIVCILIAKVLLRLGLGRSALAVLVYFAIFMLGTITVGSLAKAH